MRNQHDVFISYSSKHTDAANAICHVLESHGIRCWIAPRDIQGGEQYGDVIEIAIINSKVCVLVFSKSAQDSNWVNAEVNLAFEQGKPIIPYRVEDTPLQGQIKLMLNQKHWIDSYPDYATKFKDLVDAVSNALGQPSLDIPKQKKKVVFPKPLRYAIFFVLLFIVLISGYCVFLVDQSRKIEGLKEQSELYAREIEKDCHQYINWSDELSVKQMKAVLSIMRNMIKVEGGSFMQGALIIGEAETDNLVCVDVETPQIMQVVETYYIGKYEVSKAEWCGIMDVPYDEKDSVFPMNNVSYDDCIEFTTKLSEMVGLNFRLPTESEWEYAARGGVYSKGYIFSGSNNIDSVAWHMFNSKEKMHECRADHSPLWCNELNLYDMSGNVAELCLTPFLPYNSDIIVPDTNTVVLRGGCYMSYPYELTVYHREPIIPHVRTNSVGLRLVIANNNTQLKNL